MKRVIKLFLIFLIIIPLYVKGLTYNSYDKCIKDVNNYINKYKDNSKYLLYDVPFEYRRGSLEYNNLFYKGGLLSSDEYIISKGNLRSSYLATGKQYWTLSGDNDNHYYIDNDLLLKSASLESGIRVCEYVKPPVLVDGKGTYANPWVFRQQYYVDIRSNNKDIRIEPNNGMVSLNERFEFNVTLEKGYDLKSSDCNITKVSDNEYKTDPITKDTICVISAEKRKITINYNCGDGQGESTTQVVSYGDNYSIKDYYCTKSGYTQINWSAGNKITWSKGNKGKFEIENGERGIVDNTLTLSPMWEQSYITYYICRSDVTQPYCYKDVKDLEICNRSRTAIFSKSYKNGEIVYSEKGFIVGKGTSVTVYPNKENERYRIKSVGNNFIFDPTHKKMTDYAGKYWIKSKCLSKYSNSSNCSDCTG